MRGWKPEGWENPWGEILALSPDKRTQYLLGDIFEAGGDAVVAALKKAGEHLEEDSIFETWTTEPGTWVFIPDEKENGQS